MRTSATDLELDGSVMLQAMI